MEIRDEFSARLKSAMDESEALGCPPTRIRQMCEVLHPVEVAKRLVISGDFQDGLMNIIKRGRPDLAVESIMLEDRFALLFTRDELDAAKWRLAQHSVRSAWPAGPRPRENVNFTIDTENKEKMSVKERIVNAAIHLFYENGFNETSLRRIAQKAGTSETGVFRVFESKFEILQAVLNKSYELITHQILINLSEKGLSVDQDDVIPVLMTIAETVLNLAESENEIIKKLVLLAVGEAGISVKQYKENPEIADNFNDKIIFIDSLFERGCNPGIQPLETRCIFYGAIAHAVFARVANLGHYNKDNLLMIMNHLLRSIIKKPQAVTQDDLESRGISIGELADSARAIAESANRLINAIEEIRK